MFNKPANSQNGLVYVPVPHMSVIVILLLLVFFWPGAIIYAIIVHNNVEQALTHNEMADASLAASKKPGNLPYS